jgi:hypothetical protein
MATDFPHTIFADAHGSTVFEGLSVPIRGRFLAY